MQGERKWALIQWAVWFGFVAAVFGATGEGAVAYLAVGLLGFAGVVLHDRALPPGGVPGPGKRPPEFLAACLALAWMAGAVAGYLAGMEPLAWLGAAWSAACYAVAAWWHMADRPATGTGDAR